MGLHQQIFPSRGTFPVKSRTGNCVQENPAFSQDRNILPHLFPKFGEFFQYFPSWEYCCVEVYPNIFPSLGNIPILIPSWEFNNKKTPDFSQDSNILPHLFPKFGEFFQYFPSWEFHCGSSSQYFPKSGKHSHLNPKLGI